jgi:hypothetical protein
LAAAFHVVVIMWPGLVHAAPNDSTQRHALFVLINLAFAGAVRCMPRLAVAMMLPLVVQQICSHGADLLSARKELPARWDVRSALVLIGLPVLWLLLLWAVRTAKRQPAASATTSPDS